MQTKSEMINRIAELAEENAELKAKIKKYAAINEQETKDYAELKAENDKLKEEVRTEKLYSSQIEELEESIVGQRNAYKKLNSLYIENCEYTGKLEQTLQEIKGVVSKIIDGYIRPYGDYNQLKQILDLITKAEEE